MDQNVRGCLDQLKTAVTNSDALKRYQRAMDAVHEYPEKAKRLQEFRKKNFLLQSRREVDLYEEQERLHQEYEDLYRDPLTSEYLASELAICRVAQRMSRELIECLNIEAVLLDE